MYAPVTMPDEFKPVSIRIHKYRYTDIQRIADKRGIPPGTLMRSWIYEALDDAMADYKARQKELHSASQPSQKKRRKGGR